MIRNQLQCCIWLGAVSFKEVVDLPVTFGAGTAGRMRFPKAWTVMKGWWSSKCLKWRDGLVMNRNLQRQEKTLSSVVVDSII